MDLGKRTRQWKWTMSFGVWNTQGIRNKQQEMLRECLKLKLDIVVLSETKKKGNGKNTLENTYIYSLK